METIDRNQMIYDAFALSLWSLLIFIVVIIAITIFFKKMDAYAEGIFGIILLLFGATMRHLIEKVSEDATAGLITVVAGPIAIAIGGYLIGSSINHFRGK